MTKPFIISKNLVLDAYKLVKANAGSAGVDQETLTDFDRNLKDNLYKLWNRMSSGSYFPPAVRAVPIPKKTGGERVLGVPTVTDRIAQMVIKLLFEPVVEPHFLPDSYGYRPKKSALDAIGVTRQRCWRRNWVVEYDIKGLFDNLDHALMLKAVKKHTDSKLILLYVERWLKAPMQLPDGTLKERNTGVPQGGVISPILSNLFLHYAFDVWITKKYPSMPWCRYADDGLAHCKTEKEAQQLLVELKQRFADCKLEMHPDKSKIIYCKDANRDGKYKCTSFDFLGYTFRPRLVKSNVNILFASFSPAVSKASIKSMRDQIRQWNWRNCSDLSLEMIAKGSNPTLSGWINYYGKYNPSNLYSVLRHFNKTLVKWVMRKYKKFKVHKTRAGKFMESISKRQPHLFHHWKIGMVGVFV
jgi:RNA-directed DNA polymerase